MIQKASNGRVVLTNSLSGYINHGLETASTSFESAVEILNTNIANNTSSILFTEINRSVDEMARKFKGLK